jgi:hypothetical protein
MNTKAVKFNRSNIEGYPEKLDTATDKLIQEIVEKTSQTSTNKADELAVMQSMLNDKEFAVAIFERGKGYVGSRSPRNEAIQLTVDTLSSVTGMTSSEALALSQDYQFTKKDAGHFINIGKDFVGTYLQTGRKTTLISEPRMEATVSLKLVEAHDKSVPDRENPGTTKMISTPEKLKMVVSNKR